MSRVTLFLLLLLLFLTMTLSAQTRIDGGFAFGRQPYENYLDNPRYLPSIDVLARRGNFGVHVAIDYADLDVISAMFATHLNLVYRTGQRNFVLAGAGPTIIYAGSTKPTWNAELEAGHAWKRVEVFARVRQYDFDFTGYREDASPNGPALYAGVRFALRR